jgi:hypothetical protein
LLLSSLEIIEDYEILWAVTNDFVVFNTSDLSYRTKKMHFCGSLKNDHLWCFYSKSAWAVRMEKDKEYLERVCFMSNPFWDAVRVIPWS